MIEEFERYLETEVRESGHTVEAYGRDLRQFAEWLSPTAGSGSEFSATPGEPDWTLVSQSDIREWIGSLAEEGREPTTLRRKIQSLRAFYRWGRRRGHFLKNPAADLPLVKKRRQLPNFIKETEMETLLASVIAGRGEESGTDGRTDDTKETEFYTARTHIVLTLLYSLGLRQAELLLLTDGDLTPDRRELRVTGKRNKQRVVPIPDALSAEIKEWQRIRDAHLKDLPSPRPLIAGRSGALSKEMLYRIVRTGLGGVSAGRKSPHTLRHTFATSMLNHGADIDAVREMLGHASLQTTQVYTHVSYKELLRSYRDAHPRATKKRE